MECVGLSCVLPCAALCSEYAAHHLLQQNHHHNRDLLAAAAAAQPQHILALQQQLVAGADMHLDMLAYGNISSSEATDLAGRLQQLLPAQGLADPACWPPLGRVFSLSPLSFTGDGGTAAGEEGAALGGCEAASPAAAVSAMEVDSAAATGEAEGEGGSSSGGCGGALCVYLPENPNPSNSNNAVYYWVQVREERGCSGRAGPHARGKLANPPSWRLITCTRYSPPPTFSK